MNSPESLSVRDAFAVRIQIAKVLSSLLPGQARLVVGDVSQTGGSGGILRQSAGKRIILHVLETGLRNISLTEETKATVSGSTRG